ncbi:sensor histidine kinase [Bacillus sp. FSL K6-3431]|uniref:sensor histidine kinase n=1 Tax=Bacillus sp. FSL K6-3431 TaxID=2921500 RepID=UPI0030F97FAC
MQSDKDERIFSLILLECALAFALYFFLPVMKKPLWLYVSLQAIIFTLFLLDVSLIWIWIFLLYSCLEAVFQLSVIHYRLYIIYSSALLILLCVVKSEWSFILFLFTSFIFFLGILLNQSIGQREEQQYLYEQLVGEYRNVKRMNIENERMARLEERTRIARDIHDSVGHKLTALLMQLEILTIQKKTDEYTDLKKLAFASLEETRQAVKTLKNEEVSGITSVLQLIRKLEAENHLLVKFTTKQGVLLTKLTNEQSIVMYRAIQEALTNTMKHASSREVSVTLGRSAIGELEWIIANSMEHPIPFEPGFGLTAMRERVEEQKGKLRVYQTDHEFIIEGSMPVEGKMS